MGMVVQHNISAMNANEAMRKNVAGLKKQTEKLSTGYSINRAADNASGLAVSEKMRSQIRGLTQATANSNDAISLIQTAEGGLQETEDILQRMRELAVQSANGTYTDEDRMQIQHEVDALKGEIDRIAESTEYNTLKLLDGSKASGATNKIDFAAGSLLELEDPSASTKATNKTSTLGASDDGVTPDTVPVAAGDSIDNIKFSLTYKDKTTGATQTMTFDLGKISSAAAAYADGKTAYNAITGLASNEKNTDFTSLADALKNSPLGDDYTFTITGGEIKAEARVEGGDKFEMLSGQLSYDVNGKTAVAKSGASVTEDGASEKYSITLNTAAAASDGTTNTKFSLDGQNFEIVKLGNTASEGYTAIYAPNGVGNGAAKEIAAQLREHGIEATNVDNEGSESTSNIYIAKKNLTTGDGKLTFQIGANGVEDQRLSVAIDDMSTGALGVAGVSVALQADANASIDQIDKAIQTVSSQRAKLGAVQNRLEHTVNSLNTANENLSAAESQIRDTDMAAEMIKYTKSNILQQASQSMLAQANQQPQGVLQLLG
jgi:flagellin